ncbi:uncharacterized protein LOC133903007 [Phragmites australis]|uniref:uncharacterized protein LOC133903007 n=1 Tax=Phragmites australis TaxID=29695 RepID=UPI002D774BA9|nr:uncharacterized protein LOC133903007 [Phragmites australis]
MQATARLGCAHGFRSGHARVPPLLAGGPSATASRGRTPRAGGSGVPTRRSRLRAPEAPASPLTGTGSSRRRLRPASVAGMEAPLDTAPATIRCRDGGAPRHGRPEAALRMRVPTPLAGFGSAAEGYGHPPLLAGGLLRKHQAGGRPPPAGSDPACRLCLRGRRLRPPSRRWSSWCLSWTHGVPAAQGLLCADLQVRQILRRVHQRAGSPDDQAQEQAR